MAIARPDHLTAWLAWGPPSRWPDDLAPDVRVEAIGPRVRSLRWFLLPVLALVSFGIGAAAAWARPNALNG